MGVGFAEFGRKLGPPCCTALRATVHLVGRSCKLHFLELLSAQPPWRFVAWELGHPPVQVVFSGVTSGFLHAQSSGYRELLKAARGGQSSHINWMENIFRLCSFESHNYCRNGAYQFCLHDPPFSNVSIQSP